MRIVAVVQSRFGSARLPGKAMLALRGRPMLDHVLERVTAVPGIDAVVLATTTTERDDALIGVAAKRGVKVHRGPEADVLARMFGAAEEAEADAVLRVTADCPLWAPDVATKVLGRFVESQCQAFPFNSEVPDYCSNDTSNSGYPDGLDVEVFSMAALWRALDETAWSDEDEAKAAVQKVQDREHVTPWIRRHLHCHTLLHEGADLRRLKLSVDRRQDFDRVVEIYASLTAGELGWQATAAACKSLGLIEADERIA